MLTAVKVAFCFCIMVGVFEETVSWTIDLPQVRKYFFEKSLNDRAKYDTQMKDKVLYDNINTHSLHTDYDKYREHYADEYKYHGYMEQKVHDAVRNGSAYLEGLRRSIEAYTRRLETCRRQNVTANIIQFRPNFLNTTTGNLTNISPGNLPNLSSGNLTNLSLADLTNLTLPTNFTGPPNNTYVAVLTTNFTNFVSMFANYTMFNTSDGFAECVRADLASEHVRRLAQLAVWAASELQDKLYEDKYTEHDHGHEHEHDDTLVLRLAWFLDRLAHLTGYDPKPELRQDRDQPSASPPLPLTLMATVVSPEDMRMMTSCLRGEGGTATERCAWEGRVGAPMDTRNYRGWPVPPTSPPDLRPSASENQEYTYSEQDFTDDDMPLSLPQRPKTKRSVQVDPLLHLAQYYAKYKAWTGSNQDLTPLETDSQKSNRDLKSSDTNLESNSQNTDSNLIRPKRFIVKKLKHFKPNPISSIVKKLEVHVKKNEKEAKSLKKFFEKHIKRPKTEVKVLKFKKQKRSLKYSRKVQPRIPVNPQGDISYYVKNKPGRSYNYNVGQAAAVRAGVAQAFETGNILVVQRYGSNYNPANTMQIANGYAAGFSDV